MAELLSQPVLNTGSIEKNLYHIPKGHSFLFSAQCFVATLHMHSYTFMYMYVLTWTHIYNYYYTHATVHNDHYISVAKKEKRGARRLFHGTVTQILLDEETHLLRTKTYSSFSFHDTRCINFCPQKQN